MGDQADPKHYQQKSCNGGVSMITLFVCYERGEIILAMKLEVTHVPQNPEIPTEELPPYCHLGLFWGVLGDKGTN